MNAISFAQIFSECCEAGIMTDRSYTFVILGGGIAGVTCAETVSPAFIEAIKMILSIKPTKYKSKLLIIIIIIIMLAYFYCAAYAQVKVNESSTLCDRRSHSQCTVRGIDGG